MINSGFDYHSPQWRRLRKAILKRDEYLCRECKRYGRSTEAGVVHHILPAEDCKGANESLKFDAENLISLCAECHNKMHDRDTRGLTREGKELLKRSKIIEKSKVRRK